MVSCDLVTVVQRAYLPLIWCICVHQALDILHAERIGHGYHTLEDEKLYRRVITDGVHLEVSVHW